MKISSPVRAAIAIGTGSASGKRRHAASISSGIAEVRTSSNASPLSVMSATTPPAAPNDWPARVTTSVTSSRVAAPVRAAASSCNSAAGCTVRGALSATGWRGSDIAQLGRIVYRGGVR
jgi:hypothetical protein